MNNDLLNESPEFIWPIHHPKLLHTQTFTVFILSLLTGVVTLTISHGMTLLNQGICVFTTTKGPSWLSIGIVSMVLAHNFNIFHSTPTYCSFKRLWSFYMFLWDQDANLYGGQNMQCCSQFRHFCYHFFFLISQQIRQYCYSICDK